MEQVILVDENDNAIGTMEKMEAHRKGLLHRAFSILVFNSKGQMLLQKRSWKKYHSGGLWTNACCSHPQPDENIESAMRRKLKQEMGIDAIPEFSHKFIYKTALENNLTEHEYDHVYIARYDGEPQINRDEVDEWRFENLSKLREEVRKNPEEYTYWFRLILDHPELVYNLS
ncbi:MAG: isopentenyl-diphosphate Delta-isomerase [Bacteroidota bacterium]